MAKKQTEVMVNLGRAILTLPDGVDIPPGGEIDVAKWADNEGVKSWIADGMIGSERAIVQIDDSALRADLDAALAANADLTAKVAQLTADLEAATKPADSAQ